MLPKKFLLEKHILLLLETVLLLKQLINLEIYIENKVIIIIFASLSLLVIMMQMMENEIVWIKQYL